MPEPIAFRAIAHPTRRAILDALATGDRSVADLTRLFDVSQPAVSQHLEVLRRARLVRSRQVGRQRIYELDAAPLREVFAWSARYETFWRERLGRLGEVLERERAR